MRAIILATGVSPEAPFLYDHYPVPMIPLVDRPFIQHVVEVCARDGVSHFDFVLHHLPEKIEHHLGDGTRWGSTFTFHLARDESRPYRLLKSLDFSSAGNEPILI